MPQSHYIDCTKSELWGSDERHLDNPHLKDFYPSSYLPAIKEGGVFAWWLVGCPIPGFLWSFFAENTKSDFCLFFTNYVTVPTENIW